MRCGWSSLANRAATRIRFGAVPKSTTASGADDAGFITPSRARAQRFSHVNAIAKTPAAALRTTAKAWKRALDAYHATLAARGIMGPPRRCSGRGARQGQRRPARAAHLPGGLRRASGLRLRRAHCGRDTRGHRGQSHAKDVAWDCGIDTDGGASGNGAIQSRQWLELRRAELTLTAARSSSSARGAVKWHMTPYRLIEHVQRVGRRTVRPDEIDAITTRGLRWEDEHGQGTNQRVRGSLRGNV